MYSADFFKKDTESSTSNSISNPDLQNDLDYSNAGKERGGKNHSTTIESDSKSRDSDDDLFINEDWKIAELYRTIVDDLMADKKLEESDVDWAISKMKEDINLGHKNGFRRFRINFCKATNRCAYLRRYAVCHTGLVKQAIWRIFTRKRNTHARDIIFATSRLKVASLGGGPGNDLVGFCSALQETTNTIKELDLKVVDVGQGWVSTFPSILKRASNSDFGSLSSLLKKMKIETSFIQADLISDEVYKDGTSLSSVLAEANVVLMVKLLSFLSDKETENVIPKVVERMQAGALLIVMDHPFDEDLFWRISSLSHVYHHHHEYELSFKPARFHCPAIGTSRAYIGVFEKESTSDTHES